METEVLRRTLKSSLLYKLKYEGVRTFVELAHKLYLLPYLTRPWCIHVANTSLCNTE